jgi:hypothetical protein
LFVFNANNDFTVALALIKNKSIEIELTHKKEKREDMT